ncbi:MAG: proline--tRNA ligase [Nitrososphaerota archaeon]|nr:proline--tRNA ligase [Candidatus Calditenuaceae archaeon]MDW8073528.1 proline--tRNA ligase [Nitrososphaerota archaeon]
MGLRCILEGGFIARESEKFEQFSEWFDRVLFTARIADNRYPVKGFIVYLENGWFVIERVRRRLEELLEEDGHFPMYFPIVATVENFSREAEHIKGFMGEVFAVGKLRLEGEEAPQEAPLILRPTSETIMYPMFALWISNHSDLPLKTHQSCAVYRYETKATRALYRVREIPWNEAHTAHASMEEAEEQVRKAVEIYSKVLDELGIAYLILRRPDFDKFAGADYSIAFDAWNPDGKVNQVATVHNLGTNFSRVFGIEFERREGGKAYVWQLCYGFGYSRVLAAVIAQHGDDLGPIFPPWVAPIQVVIVPIPYKGREVEVHRYAGEVYSLLKGRYRARLDDRPDATPGEKYYFWERRGVPLRVEVGPREVEKRTVVLARRDTGEKFTVPLEGLEGEVNRVFGEITRTLAERSKNRLSEQLVDVGSLEEGARSVELGKICRVSWCGSDECALSLKGSMGAEVRGYRYGVEERGERPCIVCGRPGKTYLYVSRAY